MSELLLPPPPPPELAPPDWMEDLHEQRKELETLDYVEREVKSRIQVIEDKEQAGGNPVIEFEYNPEDINTHIELYDENGMYTLDLSLPEFMEGDPYDERRDSAEVRDGILEAITLQYMEREVRPRGEWWLNLELLEEGSLEPGFIENHSPTEQLLVGQGDRKVQFLNYGGEMSQDRLNDVQNFIELLTQYFGDKVYDLLKNVVIAPFARHNETEPRREDAVGFVKAGISGTIFIDSDLLRDDNQEMGSRIEAGYFLKVLVHEFGHLLHGSKDEDNKQLLEFAKSVGWDVERMVADEPNWNSGYADLNEYAPSGDYVVTMDDGTKQRMDWGEYSDHHSDEYGDEGEVIKQGKDYYELGSPTSYGETNPMETFADTTAYALLGHHVTENMPETRDAWIEHAQKRILMPGETEADRPIAASVERKPLEIEHRVGAQIELPATVIPETIYVLAKPQAQYALAG